MHYTCFSDKFETHLNIIFSLYEKEMKVFQTCGKYGMVLNQHYNWEKDMTYLQIKIEKPFPKVDSVYMYDYINKMRMFKLSVINVL